ncbi:MULTISPECIES: DUF1073 domain-containing protein [Pseudomonadota]|uniref:phage portal protein n=1 Tax=Pseudomonadota TaxID=1224 RepID=UPI00200BE446|nr:DUF1073 domain-containing protein [Halomonas venusta]UQI42746.1 DUF1073 domain-containing protein [Halomonas venusta]
MPTYKEDGYRSALVGGRRKQSQIVDYANLYARGGIYARVIDIPADLAMSRGIEVKGDDNDIITNEFDRLDLVGNMSDALRWSRLDGGSALMLLTDTGTLAEPLPDSFGQITEIRVVEIDQLSVAPGGYYDDPSLPTFGQPEIYQVRPIQMGNTASTGFFTVHESRLLPVYGDPLPARRKIGARVPWLGRSAAIEAYSAIDSYKRSLRLSIEILRRKQQAVHKMKGLAQLIERGQEDLVRKRVDLVDDVRSLMNGVAVDAEDDYTVYDQSVNGIKDLIAEHQVAVSAELGIPVTVLFGRSAAGLNNTGENDLESLYDLCEGIQKTSAQPAIERLIEAIGKQQGVTLPSDWKIDWPSLWTPTDAQQAETRHKNAQADKAEAEARQIDYDMGVVSGGELRQSAIAEGRYDLGVANGSA